MLEDLIQPDMGNQSKLQFKNPVNLRIQVSRLEYSYLNLFIQKLIILSLHLILNFLLSLSCQYEFLNTSIKWKSGRGGIDILVTYQVLNSCSGFSFVAFACVCFNQFSFVSGCCVCSPSYYRRSRNYHLYNSGT